MSSPLPCTVIHISLSKYRYALERHLKQNEVIYPPPPETVELGKFRGEPVYPRGAVVPLKTAETWMRTEGRTIKSGSQPLKMIKLRASTVGKMREVEVLREASSGGGDAAAASEVMQGLYARSQTERFVPDPVIDVSLQLFDCLSMVPTSLA